MTSALNPEALPDLVAAIELVLCLDAQETTPEPEWCVRLDPKAREQLGKALIKARGRRFSRDTNPHGVEVPLVIRLRVEEALAELAEAWGDSDPLVCWHAPPRGAIASVSFDGVLIEALNNAGYTMGGWARFDKFQEAMNRLQEAHQFHYEMQNHFTINIYRDPEA